MRKRLHFKEIVLWLVVALLLVGLWLAINIPSSYQDLQAVYQGF
jgi:hypothetical protein